MTAPKGKKNAPAVPGQLGHNDPPAIDNPVIAAEDADPRDAIIEQLKAELAAKTAPPVEDLPPDDPRDRAIWELKRQLAEVNATPESEAAELRKAMAALRAEMERMSLQQGLIPVPVTDGVDPMLYGMFLGCGCMGVAQHPVATQTHCPTHDMTVTVREYYNLAPEQAKEADAAYKKELADAAKAAKAEAK